MENKLISIILSTYNGSKYISKSIESVLNQSYKNFEFIIINDTSTDNVEDIILKYKDKDNRIIYVKNKKNLERSKSKNKWVSLAKWEYISFIDDDDIWSDENKLKKQIYFLNKHKDYWLIWTNAITINEENNITWKIIVKSTNYEIKNNILITNQFIQSSVLMKKKDFLKVWWFNEKINLCEDYDLWLKIWKITKIANLSDFSIKYLIRKNNTTSKNNLKMKLISIKLAYKNKQYYNNYYIALFIRLITFFIPINIITKIRKVI